MTRPEGAKRSPSTSFRGPPVGWYSQPDRYSLEIERIFHRTWQYAGPLDHVLDAGDYMTWSIGPVPVLVVRGDDNELRAFGNVCRHRRNELVHGHGQAKTFQCQYHAWTYDLRGRLLAAPRTAGEPGFEPTELGLVPFAVDTWGPMVFVNLDPQAHGIETALGPVPELFVASGLRMRDLHFRARREYPMLANWKVAVENILECYHCPVVHPAYNRVMDLQHYSLEIGSTWSVQSANLRTEEEVSYNTSGAVRAGVYAYVWPNWMANVNPGIGHFHINYARPDSPTECTMVNDFFFVDEVSESDSDAYVDFQNQVSLEDIAPVEGVQRGIVSGIVEDNRLLESEQLIQHFQTLVQTR